MDFLGSHRKDEEEIFNEIYDIKGVDKTKVYSPNQILNGICKDKGLFKLYSAKIQELTISTNAWTDV